MKDLNYYKDLLEKRIAMDDEILKIAKEMLKINGVDADDYDIQWRKDGNISVEAVEYGQYGNTDFHTYNIPLHYLVDVNWKDKMLEQQRETEEQQRAKDGAKEAQQLQAANKAEYDLYLRLSQKYEN